jgi:cytochrome c peroxidase
VDPGAYADRDPDRRPDARGRGGQLALSAAGARLLTLAAAAAATALAGAAPDATAPASAAPGARGTSAYVWHLPRGFPRPYVPPDNPMSEAKVALGERLFFEPRLSVTARYACASCHDPARAFSDGRRLAIGATGAALPHNALALVNVAYNIAFGWAEPGVRSLEAQMREPLENEHPVELGLSGREAQVCAALAADPAYAAAFAAAFPGPDPVRFGHIVQAIAAFERTLISGDSPFDRYVFGGDSGALTPAAKEGMALFFSARIGCVRCHSGFNFAGNWRDADGATGRAAFADDGTGAGKLKVPTLRNVALTAPYMHDGRFATLQEVLAHYARIGRRAAAGARYDPRLPHAPLSEPERAALIAFLESLTDPAFARRFAHPARLR